MTTRSEKAQEEVRQFKHNIHQIIALILGAIILLFFIIAAIIIFEDKYKYGYEVTGTIVEKIVYDDGEFIPYDEYVDNFFIGDTNGDFGLLTKPRYILECRYGTRYEVKDHANFDALEIGATYQFRVKDFNSIFVRNPKYPIVVAAKRLKDVEIVSEASIEAEKEAISEVPKEK